MAGSPVVPVGESRRAFQRLSWSLHAAGTCVGKPVQPQRPISRLAIGWPGKDGYGHVVKPRAVQGSPSAGALSGSSVAPLDAYATPLTVNPVRSCRSSMRSTQKPVVTS
jgi:hypothetical protein